MYLLPEYILSDSSSLFLGSVAKPLFPLAVATPIDPVVVHSATQMSLWRCNQIMMPFGPSFPNIRVPPPDDLPMRHRQSHFRDNASHRHDLSSPSRS
jgi:hypothetical protein